jgi:hypothetical protein
VRVKANHPLDKFGFFVHVLFYSYAGGRNRVRRLQALRYTGRSPGRCFAPVLIHTETESDSHRLRRASPESPPAG